MPKPTPKQRRLADALTRLKELQDAGRMAIGSSDLTRQQRSALEEAGFIRRVVKGWYLPSRPSDTPGDSTAWFAGMREFIGDYCEARFGENWHLSPAHSLLLQAGVTALPKQLIVHAPKGANNVLSLPQHCSLVEYSRPLPPADALTRVGPLRVLTVPRALVDVPENFFRSFPVEAQVALAQIRDASDLSRVLLDGHPVVAGRLAGALRAAGAGAIADDILDTMRTAGYDVRETNPFTAALPILGRARQESPYVGRMQLLWPRLRDAVLEVFPAEPGLPPGGDARAAYLDNVQATYVLDAYHSLSIEGYRVTEALIRRVAGGEWRQEENEADARQRDAMAARGYHDAFNVVKESIAHILDGDGAARVVANEHGRWYRQLFAPSVTAGLVSASDLAGYRNQPVFIKNASHVPPPHEAVRDLMPALFELLASEPSAAVRAVLGHFFFVFIHPYMDGNGRMGRFLMNTMLASGGYPWTVIQVQTRPEYFAALDAASTRGEIRQFAEFVATSLANTPEATASGASHETARAEP
jgi:hypothetical protein